MRRRGRTLGLLLLACCAQRSGSEGAAGDGSASTHPSAASTPRGAVVRGDTLALVGERLLRVDAERSGLTSLALPASSRAAMTRHPLPGRAVQLARTSRDVLVTLASPSALLALRLEDLSERLRVSVPGGASAMMTTPAGDVLVLTTESPRLSLVDLERGEVVWSVAVPDKPWGLTASADHERLYVTHRLSAGATEVTRRGGGWREPPEVTAARSGPVLVDGLALSVPAGVVRIHGDVDATRPRFALGQRRGHMPALPKGTFVRALAAGASASSMLVATDDVLIELELPTFNERSRARHRCRDPKGLVLTRGGAAALVACADGRVAELTLPLSDREPVRYYEPQQGAAPQCDPGDGGRISDAFAGMRYVTAKEVERILKRYRCRYPGRTHLLSIAKTHEERDVWALAIGRAPQEHDRATIFLNGGHHGDELMATTFALDAIAALLEDNVAVDGLEDVVFVVAPLVNPDGNAHRFAKGLGRKNGRDNDGDGVREADEGVDLNRNYPFRWGALGESGSSSKPGHKWYRGPSAGSEPETRGVMRLANSEKFAAAMSFHTGALSLCASYTIPNVKNPEPDVAWSVGWEIVTRIPPHPEGGVPVQRRLYPLDGNDQDWYRHTHGTLAFLWEGGEDWVSHPPRGFRASARGAWLALARRLVRGPAFSLRVRDVSGRPLDAVVEVLEIEHREGERWTTRCRDGRFDAMLPGPGDYTVVVKRGKHRIERPLSVGKGEHPQLDVTLPVLVDEPATCPTPTGDGGPPAKVLQVR